MYSIITEFRIACQIIKVNILAAFELRTSFVLQIVGMMINNIAFVLIWIFFFHAFGSINGWSTYEVIALQGVDAFVFGFAFTFMSGVLYLPDYVNNGSFDNILLSPRNLYVRILTNQIRVSAVGDMIFGVLLMGVYIIISNASLVQVLMLGTLLVPAVLVIVNVTLITSLSSFIFPDAAAFAKNLFEVFFSPSLYPSGLFQGAMRFIFTFLIPSLIIAGIPVEAVRDVSWKGYVLVWATGFVWTYIAIKLLSLAVRRYESGNLTGARV